RGREPGRASTCLPPTAVAPQSGKQDPGRIDPPGGERQVAGDDREALLRQAAELASGNVGGEEAGGLTAGPDGHRGGRFAGQELLSPLVVSPHSPSPSSIARSLRIAARVRVFTVPRGTPLISAMRACVMPEKYANSSTSRCSGGSLRRARSTSSRRVAIQ